MQLPERIKIVEVGPRDGLQNEAPHQLHLDDKIQLIESLAATGLKNIEVGSFVSPKHLPQMADTGEILKRLSCKPDMSYRVLVPNQQGLEAALAAGAKEIAVFTAASDAFTTQNIRMSVAESLQRFRPLVQAAQTQGIAVRGYLSTLLDCPYSGKVPSQNVLRVAEALLEMGCYEVSLGETTGRATALDVEGILEDLAKNLSLTHFAVHFHDTYGQALTNVWVALKAGITTIDASVAGLGGCPYAPGASGNLATEDLVYLLHGLGIQTSVDLNQLVQVGAWISQRLHKPYASKAGYALFCQQPSDYP